MAIINHTLQSDVPSIVTAVDATSNIMTSALILIIPGSNDKVPTSFSHTTLCLTPCKHEKHVLLYVYDILYSCSGCKLNEMNERLNGVLGHLCAHIG